jgi:UDP-2-acetamido-3-amino-2,3-dideoxy-glucuronate N-acetyltransferase
MIHESAEVYSDKIGKNSTIWQFVTILQRAKIGDNCNINANVFIENDVEIGNNVTIKCGVQIWDGITIEDDVFIGPNATFTNEIIVSRSKQYPTKFEKTLIQKGASIGANATIIAGNIIGEYSMIGAGSVVTKNIGRNELWIGNPARKIGYVSNEGDILNLDLKSKKNNVFYEWINSSLIKKK